MYIHPVYHWPPKSQWSHVRSAKRRWGAFSAYIHFPFCRNICDYCGYETRLIDKTSAIEFPRLAVNEIDTHFGGDDFSNAMLRSVFFGGGTASLMAESGLADILSHIQSLSRGSSVPEITLECEPGTISRRKLQAMREAGVNRVSVCAQSFDDSQLKRITRVHSSEDSLQLIEDCLDVGITNLHVDLMYGLPGQSLKDWENTVRKVADLNIKHVSAYKLFVFKHGALHRDNSVARAEEEARELTEALRSMHDVGVQIFEDFGFKQYTLTEFAKDGFECKYIQDCFGAGDLLPIGPSAFGRSGREVWENPTYVRMYGDESLWEQKKRAFQMSRLEAFKRDVVLGLWLLEVDLQKLSNMHGVQIGSEFAALLSDLSSRDLLEYRSDKLRVHHHQRFAVGEAMAKLTNFHSSQWGTASDASGNAADDLL